MRDKIPMTVVFCAGLVVILAEFIPHRPFSQIVGGLQNWFMIISGFAILLGTLSLLKMNFIKVSRKLTDWKFHVGTLCGFFVMIILGLLYGMQQQPGIFGHGEGIAAVIGTKPFDYLYSNFLQHLITAMFSLLAFFIASAAYRAFIARSFESSLMLIVSVIVMLGNTSIGSWMTSSLPVGMQLPTISEFIMNYLNTAGQRAILIGAALGVVGSSLRIILGLERSWAGGR